MNQTTTNHLERKPCQLSTIDKFSKFSNLAMKRKTQKMSMSVDASTCLFSESSWWMYSTETLHCCRMPCVQCFNRIRCLFQDQRWVFVSKRFYQRCLSVIVQQKTNGQRKSKPYWTLSIISRSSTLTKWFDYFSNELMTWVESRSHGVAVQTNGNEKTWSLRLLL